MPSQYRKNGFYSRKKASYEATICEWGFPNKCRIFGKKYTTTVTTKITTNSGNIIILSNIMEINFKRFKKIDWNCITQLPKKQVRGPAFSYSVI